VTVTASSKPFHNVFPTRNDFCFIAGLRSRLRLFGLLPKHELRSTGNQQ
jgi:hypothetical protein